MNELISVIIPIYNNEKYLDDCLNSIINQTYKNLEIILIDDGSTDASYKICEKYKEQDSRIVLIHKDNSGVADSRNLGLKASKGKYIAFIDSDDYIELNMFEKMHQEFLKNNIDICVCYYNKIYGKKVVSQIYNKVIDENNVNFYDLVLNTDYLIQGYLWNKLFLKSSLKSYFNHDVFITEDLLFILQNYKENTKYKIIYEPLYNYRMQNDSALNSNVLNTKKLSVIISDVWICNNINNKYVYINKYSIVNTYYLAKAGLEKNIFKNEFEKYKKLAKKYEKELLKGNDLSINQKCKILFKKYLFLFFKILVRIKYKIIN